MSGWTVQRLNACIWWQVSCIAGSRAGASPALPIDPPSTLPIRLPMSAVPAADTTCALFSAPFEYLSLAPPLPDLRELLKIRRCGTPLEADRYDCACSRGEAESITGWVIGEYGAGGGEGASVVMVVALAMAVVAVVAVVVADTSCGILLSAGALTLLQRECLLMTPPAKHRRCILPELGPMYRALSRPRYCWLRFLLL